MPVILLIVVLVVIYAIVTYNSLISIRTQIRASIQEIGNQLKRQSDLIPNLEESVKGYLKHEKDIIKALAEARKMAAAGQDASQKISEILPKLQVVVESNPQIRGAEVVSNLMNELRDTSDKVMYSRRTLIDLVADFNIKLATFPSNLVANAFGFKPEAGLETPTSGEFLKVSSAETQTPKVSL